MRLFPKFLIGFISSFWILALFNSPVFADENFSKSLQSTYTINNLGTAKVEHIITITNKNPLFYVSKYAIKISSANLGNVAVSVDNQPLQANVITSNKDTSIAVTFPDKVVGQGKSRTLRLTYDNPDSTVVTGNTLAVYVPKIADKNDYQDYSLTIYSPEKYGYPTRTYPIDHFSSKNEGQIKTEFKNIAGQGVSALFGSSQIFDLTLRYNLENDTANAGLMQIAFPPDSTYQKMYYIDISPEPIEIKSDLDGNWIATYKVDAQSNKIVYVTAKAKITLEPNLEYPNRPPIKSHLEEKDFWQVHDSTIQDLADQLGTPKQIYDYVVNHLTYNELVDLNRKRLGAKQALEQSDQAVCQEFTDAFIAIARAADIPARRITGYAYSENSTLRPLSLVEDILHTWPEYYQASEKRWQPVDPTWENTTGGIDYFNQFDLNHIVFAINGVDSSLPYSAGSYKLTDQNSKDVEIRFSDDFPQIKPSFVIQLEAKQFGSLKLPGIYNLQIQNLTGQAFYNLPLQIVASQNTSIYYDTDQTKTILPFQTISLPLYMSNNSIIPNKDTLFIYLYEQQTKFDITSGTNFNFIFSYSPIAIGMGFSLVIITLITGSLLVFRRKK